MTFLTLSNRVAKIRTARNSFTVMLIYEVLLVIARPVIIKVILSFPSAISRLRLHNTIRITLK